VNKAVCNNCRWLSCKIRTNVDRLNYYCDEWEHIQNAVPTGDNDVDTEGEEPDW
jgi:hypothetical protein